MSTVVDDGDDDESLDSRPNHTIANKTLPSPHDRWARLRAHAADRAAAADRAEHSQTPARTSKLSLMARSRPAVRKKKPFARSISQDQAIDLLWEGRGAASGSSTRSLSPTKVSPPSLSPTMVSRGNVNDIVPAEDASMPRSGHAASRNGVVRGSNLDTRGNKSAWAFFRMASALGLKSSASSTKATPVSREMKRGGKRMAQSSSSEPRGWAQARAAYQAGPLPQGSCAAQGSSSELHGWAHARAVSEAGELQYGRDDVEDYVSVSRRGGRKHGSVNGSVLGSDAGRRQERSGRQGRSVDGSAATRTLSPRMKGHRHSFSTEERRRSMDEQTESRNRTRSPLRSPHVRRRSHETLRDLSDLIRRQFDDEILELQARDEKRRAQLKMQEALLVTMHDEVDAMRLTNETLMQRLNAVEELALARSPNPPRSSSPRRRRCVANGVDASAFTGTPRGAHTHPGQSGYQAYGHPWGLFDGLEEAEAQETGDQYLVGGSGPTQRWSPTQHYLSPPQQLRQQQQLVQQQQQQYYPGTPYSALQPAPELQRYPPQQQYYSPPPGASLHATLSRPWQHSYGPNRTLPHTDPLPSPGPQVSRRMPGLNENALHPPGRSEPVQPASRQPAAPQWRRSISPPPQLALPTD